MLNTQMVERTMHDVKMGGEELSSSPLTDGVAPWRLVVWRGQCRR